MAIITMIVRENIARGADVFWDIRGMYEHDVVGTNLGQYQTMHIGTAKRDLKIGETVTRDTEGDTDDITRAPLDYSI